MVKQTVTVKTDEENPEPVELIADSIIKISDAFDKIKNSRLNERAVILLIKDSISGNAIGLKDIENVLHAAASLKKNYIKQPA